jgi:hypothetical protein
MLMRGLGLYVAVFLSVTAPASLAAECGVTSPPLTFPQNRDGVEVAVSSTADALLFKLRPGQMSLDLDGNAHTYGVHDQGIDGICNGLSALNPPQCAGVTPRGACFQACQKAIRDWDGTPEDAKSKFCSIGLGSGCGSTFAAPRQMPPNEEFFVSATSTKYVRPANSPSDWFQTQAAQIDPLVIPFFVLPPAMRRLPFDASPGDAGVMIRADKAKPPVFFIIGDSGNDGEIGESSAKIHQSLSLSGQLPTKEEISAVGQRVDRVAAPASPGVAVAIFRHTSKRPNGVGSAVDLTPETIMDWINTTGAAHLDRLGGAETLLGCVAGLSPRN